MKLTMVKLIRDINTILGIFLIFLDQ